MDNEARAALAARCEGIALRKCVGFDASERVMGIGTGKPQTRLSLALTASQFSRNKLRRWKDCARATPPSVTTEHMPFAGHRNCAEVEEDQARDAIRRGLGR